MTTVKLKIKINNSYESDPLSGDGSSTNEANEFENHDREDQNINIMFNTIFNSSASNANVGKIKTSSDTRNSSSEESDFEGFSDYQIKERTVCISKTDRKVNSSFKDMKKAHDTIDKRSSAPEKTKRPPHICDDIIIEQNSCNIFDMHLSVQTCHDYNQILPDKLSNELTFDGTIKRLSVAPIKFICRKPSTMSNLKAVLVTGETLHCYEKSPDLFDDTETDDKTINFLAYENDGKSIGEGNKSFDCPKQSNFQGIVNENLLRQNIRREKETLKRIQNCLSGIPPPPSLTVPQIDMFSAVAKYKEEILNFKSEIEAVSSVMLPLGKSILKSQDPLADVLTMPWKDILGVRGHGLCYNLCKASESIELLNLAVIERFVGEETSTSYTASYKSSPSSAKKRNLRQKMLTQTSGYNRLSHLAKRRAVFSSANLATTLLKQQSYSLGSMQILLDKKKGKNARKGTTPKRIIPSSKKKAADRKTPFLSSRKLNFFRSDVLKTGHSRESSKRALFQSPAKQRRMQADHLNPSLKTEIANRVEKSKRALFSPDKPLINNKSTPIVFGSLSQASQSIPFGEYLESFTLKRKRTEEDFAEGKQKSKEIYRQEIQSLTPRSLKIKSQSFCIGAGSTNVTSTNNLRINSSIASIPPTYTNSNGKPITKAYSDTSFHKSNLLTENHRKKLLWAVSQALQIKQINVTHVSFKQFASVLARVVRRLFQEYFLKSNSSTSDTMLRLAKKYVSPVMSGKTADDIYIHAKSKIEEEMRMHSGRLSGYIALNVNEICKPVNNPSLFNFEKSLDLFAANQSPAKCITQPSKNIQNSEEEKLHHPKSGSAIKLTVQSNSISQNSSSKNNLDGIALRENVDCEQRRSAQKCFTGINQQNVSPYANLEVQSTSQTLSFKRSFYEFNSTTAKAKRQITFC